MPYSKAVTLTQALVQKPSVTPDDQGCQAMISKHLGDLGFKITDLSQNGVSNLWAKYGNGPCLVYVGHTDVVPTGPKALWRHPPFAATISDGILYGRGAADMKSSIAAMITAIERFLSDHQPLFSIALAITSDEEGPATDGCVRICEYIQKNNIAIDWCLVGEPSSTERLGDIIKIGRRGSLHGHLTLKGKQGHVAYPHLAVNPIHQAPPVLQALCNTHWDNGCADFPPTTMQISNIHAGEQALNVVPGEIKIDFNFRFGATSTPERLMQKTEEILESANIPYEITWRTSAEAFITPSGALRDAICEAVRKHTGISPKATTTGGTSDGRFFAPLGCEIVELGVINKSIHQINEQAAIDDITALSDMYFDTLVNLQHDIQKKN